MKKYLIKKESNGNEFTLVVRKDEFGTTAYLTIDGVVIRAKDITEEESNNLEKIFNSLIKE